MARIAIIADEHDLPPSLEGEAFFPTYYASMHPEDAAKAYSKYRRIIGECRTAVLERLEKMGRDESWDLLVHAGDISSGWRGTGIAHETVVPVMERFTAQYRSLASAYECSWGDHDVGLRRQGGLSAESVRQCNRIARLFWHYDLYDIRFIGICNPLMQRYDGPESEYIESMRMQQASYLSDQLVTLRGRRWVLVTHNLHFGSLINVIAPFVGQLERVVCGHLHAPWASVMQRTLGHAAPFGTLATLKRKSIVCPAVAPVWWPGGGFLECTDWGKRFSIKRRRVSLPESLEREIASMPFASLWRSAYHVKKRRLLQWHNSLFAE